MPAADVDLCDPISMPDQWSLANEQCHLSMPSPPTIKAIQRLEQATSELTITRPRKSSLAKPRENSNENQPKTPKRVHFSEDLATYKLIPPRHKPQAAKHRNCTSDLHICLDHDLSSFYGRAQRPDTPAPWLIGSKMSWDSDDSPTLSPLHGTAGNLETVLASFEISLRNPACTSGVHQRATLLRRRQHLLQRRRRSSLSRRWLSEYRASKFLGRALSAKVDASEPRTAIYGANALAMQQSRLETRYKTHLIPPEPSSLIGPRSANYVKVAKSERHCLDESNDPRAPNAPSIRPSSPLILPQTGLSITPLNLSGRRAVPGPATYIDHIRTQRGLPTSPVSDSRPTLSRAVAV